jgi:hypothetical protein
MTRHVIAGKGATQIDPGLGRMSRAFAQLRQERSAARKVIVALVEVVTQE